MRQDEKNVHCHYILFRDEDDNLSQYLFESRFWLINSFCDDKFYFMLYLYFISYNINVIVNEYNKYI